MSLAEDYRRRAYEASIVALQVKPHEEARWRELARSWLELADGLEREDLQPPWRRATG